MIANNKNFIVCDFIFIFITLNFHSNVLTEVHLAAIHAKRVTIQSKNMQLVREWMRRWNIIDIPDTVYSQVRSLPNLLLLKMPIPLLRHPQNLKTRTWKQLSRIWSVPGWRMLNRVARHQILMRNYSWKHRRNEKSEKLVAKVSKPFKVKFPKTMPKAKSIDILKLKILTCHEFRHLFSSSKISFKLW